MVRRIRCLPSASVHDRSSASPSVGVSALSSSEFMNPHSVAARQAGRGMARQLSLWNQTESERGHYSFRITAG